MRNADRHIPSIVAIATRILQRRSDWRGPGHFGAGIRAPGSAQDRMPLWEHIRREQNDNNPAVVHPGWIMDQLYILLATLHTVLLPFALLRVPQRRDPDGQLYHVRTIRQQGRFVQTFTMNIVCLAQTFMPQMFQDTSIICTFPMDKVLDIIRALIDAALRGNPKPSNGSFTFRWDGFYLGTVEYNRCCHETLRGYAAAMTHT